MKFKSPTVFLFLKSSSKLIVLPKGTCSTSGGSGCTPSTVIRDSSGLLTLNAKADNGTTIADGGLLNGQYGGILGAAQAGKLGLMAASASPQISEALLPFNPVSLARLLLPAAAGHQQPIPFRKAG